MRPLHTTVLLWLALLTAPAFAGGEAGFVEDYEGEASRYRIERGAERVPVALLTPVEEGDRVIVEHPEGRIRLRLGEAHAVTLTRGEGPFLVGEADESATVLGNLARWAIGWTESGPGSDTARVSLTTRSVDLAMPLCPLDVEQRLPAGHSQLHLEWSAGAPPFVVRLLRDGAVVSEQADLATRRTSLPLEVTVAAGPARLELTDAIGHSVAVALRFVEREGGAAPASQPADEGSGVAHLMRAFDALDLGDAGRLAAYQELSYVVGEYPPAAAVRDALALGRAPATPSPGRAPDS